MYKIVHCNIKPPNILLDKKFNVIITDFGIAKKLKDNSKIKFYNRAAAGTIKYFSPEMY